MTEGSVPAALPADINIDNLFNAETWEEPKEIIPVRVKSSLVKMCDEKYMAATEFRAALPKPILQWEFNLEALDRVYILQDGSTAPVILYAGIDLQKLDKKTGLIRNLQMGKSKEFLIITSWAAVVGPISPNPERLTGQMFIVDRFREKKIAGGGKALLTAKNVVLPAQPLPPSYTYTGEIQRIPVTRQDSVDDAAGASASTFSAPDDGLSLEDRAQQLATYLATQTAPYGSSLLGKGDFPVAARREPFISAIAGGTIEAVLSEKFGITVGGA